MRVIGVDPGATHTGIVVAEFSGSMTGTVMHQQTLHRPSPIEEFLPIENEYLVEVRRTLEDLIAKWRPDYAGVETVNRPSWWIGGRAKPANPEPIIATAIILGVAMGVALDRFPAWEVYQIPPDGNGAGVFGYYPECLVSKRERGQLNWRTRQAGKGVHCHERSAYDVAVQTTRTVRRGNR